MPIFNGISNDNIKVIISIVTAIALIPKLVSEMGLLFNKLKYLPDYKELESIEKRLKATALNEESQDYLKEQQARLIFRTCYKIDAGPEMRRALHKFHHDHEGEINWNELRTAYARIRLIKQNGKDTQIYVAYGISDSIHKFYVSAIIWYIRWSAFVTFVITLLIAFGEVKVNSGDPPVRFVYSGLMFSSILWVLALVYQLMSLPSRSIQKIHDIVMRTPKSEP